MLHIGCHLSSAKGYQRMGREALEIKADTFQFFTRNPRGGAAKAVDPDDMMALGALLTEQGCAQVLAHAPYTLNLCGKEDRVREFAHRVLCEDLAFMERWLPGQLYNVHPGSHVGQGLDAGIALIVDLLDRVLTPDHTTTILLETMSGRGSEIGGRFEELAAILNRVAVPERVGVCLDTCHVFAAGYDLAGDLDGMLEHFDAIVGLDRLRAVHLNDSLTPFASGSDRHARIGEGNIGLQALVAVINHPRLRHLPFCLETPNELSGYADEIALLRNAFQG